MRIDSIELFHVAMPLRHPAETSRGSLESLETVLVRMQSGSTAGWGEASPGTGPLAAAEWAAGVFACLKDWMAPAVVSATIDSGDALQERLDCFRGNPFAKAALDTAWWDLHARIQGKPLHELLGGQRQAVEVGVTFDRTDSFDEFLAAIGRAFQDGFARVKLMFRPGWDVEMLRLVRSEFPGETFHIDCEGALNLGQMEMLCRLDDFALAMIEQPLPADDLVGHAMVQEAIRTPLCLDEGVATLAQAEMALELKSCQYLNVTPGRVGGLTPAIAIHDACRDASVPCFVGATPQSAIGARHGLALAAKANFEYPADFLPPQQVLADDLAEPPLATREAADTPMRVAMWPEPGIGVEPDPERLEKLCLARATIADPKEPKP